MPTRPGPIRTGQLGSLASKFSPIMIVLPSESLAGGAAAARRRHRANLKQHRGYIGRGRVRGLRHRVFAASRVSESGRGPAGSVGKSKLLLFTGSGTRV